MYQTIVQFGILAGVLTLAGCQQQATPGHSLDQIVTAYEQALADGQYATRLAAFVHPELGSLPSGNAMLADRPVDVEEKSTLKEKSDVRELTSEQQHELEQYFDFTVVPTHVIDFTTVKTKGPTTWTAVSPLYLVRAGSGWNVVVGKFKGPQALAKSYDQEQLSFNQEPGLWQDHWELQFELEAPLQYEVVLQQVGVAAPVETLLAADDIRFNDTQKVIRFHLIPEGATTAWEQDAAGKFSLPYACQAGSQATSSWASLPAKSITKYEPNETPSFVDDTITLARLTGEGEQGPVEFVLQVKRFAK